jgi:hypothetical protein
VNAKLKKVLKVVGFIVGGFFILFVGLMWGAWSNEATVEGKLYDIELLDEEMVKIVKEYRDVEEKVKSANKEVDALKKEKDEAIALIDNKAKVEKELAEVNAKLKDTQGALDKELADGRKEIEVKLAEAKKGLTDEQAKVKAEQAKVQEVQGQLEDVQSKLATASGQLQKAEGDPKTLGAGQYVVGKDLPEGRYVVTNIGRGTNFFVYDGSTGSSTVNTILGEGSIGSGDYTFYTADGDIIETRGQVKLTPVK